MSKRPTKKEAIYYRLFSGKTTTDSDEYTRDWRVIINVVEGFFPGYKCTGYDPGMTLYSQKKNNSISLHSDAIEALLNSDKHRFQR